MASIACRLRNYKLNMSIDTRSTRLSKEKFISNPGGRIVVCFHITKKYNFRYELETG